MHSHRPKGAYRRHVAMLMRERVLFDKEYHPAGKMFCHPDGTPLHPDTITRRFNRMVDSAGVPRIRLHDVRHSYVTVCLDAGVDSRSSATGSAMPDRRHRPSLHPPEQGAGSPHRRPDRRVGFGPHWHLPMPSDGSDAQAIDLGRNLQGLSYAARPRMASSMISAARRSASGRTWVYISCVVRD